MQLLIGMRIVVLHLRHLMRVTGESKQPAKAG